MDATATPATDEQAQDLADARDEHRCGFDFDPYCDGCRVAVSDAGWRA